MILEMLSLTRSKDLTGNAIYTGNGGTQEIDLNVDLATPSPDGFAVIANRDNTGWANIVGVANSFTGNSLSGESQITLGGSLTTSGVLVAGTTYPNQSTKKYVTFGVTVGNTGASLANWGFSTIADPSFVPGSTQTISHNLGVVPEAMWIWSYVQSSPKRWHHRWHSGTGYVQLEGYDYNTGSPSPPPGTTQPFNLTSTTFDIAGELTQEGGGGGYSQYYAVLYGNGQYVSCGGFTGAGAVSLGWEPQVVLFYESSTGLNTTYNYIKSRDILGNNSGDYSTTWTPAASGTTPLRTDDKIIPSSTGFTVAGLTGGYNYIAIR